MTQYNNMKLSNSQLDKLKLASKNFTEIILRCSPNLIGNFNYDINLPHKLLLADRQFASLFQIFFFVKFLQII